MERPLGPFECVNRFGLHLLALEAQRLGMRNVLISPPNLFTLFALLHAGARGETRRELTAALCSTRNGDDAVQEAADAIRSVLATSEETTQALLVRMAAAVWAAESMAFDRVWYATARSTYSAEVSHLDFAAPSAIPRMNAWVRAQTDGYIGDLFSAIDPRTVLCAATTLIFRAAWRYPFEPRHTEPGPFYRGDQPPAYVPYMQQTGQFPYWQDHLAQIIALPFGPAAADAREFSLVVILPREGVSIQETISDLLGERGTTWLRCLDYVHRYLVLPRGMIVLPRFTLAFGADPGLNDSLTALGMGRLFDPAHADLDGVLRPLVTAHVPPFLGCIQHRTVLKVDEEGAVASAASGAAMETGWPPPLEFVMEVRRPFVCALWERMSEMLLFLGVVWDPAVPG